MHAIDFNHPDFIHDPYPVYKQLREAPEPYWLAHKQTNSESPGMWLFSRYDDVSKILKASTGISKQISRVRLPENLALMELTMLNQDPPEHTRLRGLVNQAFTPRRLKALNGRIELIVDELIDGMLKETEPDFVRDFAYILPVRVIADFMGVPFEDHVVFGKWAGDILCGYDSGVTNTDNFRAYRTAISDMENYFNNLIEKRRSELGTDLVSTLIEAHEKQDRLSGAELISMCMLLLISGHETTTNMLSSGMKALLHNPDQLAMLQNDRELLTSAIEEILRYESPIPRATFRITTEDCTIGGKHLKAGEQLSAMIGAANRDAMQFEDPDRFDITRAPNAHLAFGAGIHFCLGAMLARNEARIGFGKILDRLPDIRFGNEAPVWNNKKLFRGLKTLPVVL